MVTLRCFIEFNVRVHNQYSTMTTFEMAEGT